MVITNAYGSVTSSPAMLTVPPAVVFLTWTNPATITYGTQLGANQLNASASAPGTFIYTPPAGTVPAVGTNLLTVVFNPADPVNYNDATGGVALVVLPVPLSVTAAQYVNGQFSFQLSGLTGQGAVVIQASSNMVDWQPIFTNPSGFGAVRFTDSGASNIPSRYYRAAIPPAP